MQIDSWKKQIFIRGLLCHMIIYMDCTFKTRNEARFEASQKRDAKLKKK